MDTNNNHNTTTTHNAGGSSRTLQASPSSSSGVKLDVRQVVTDRIIGMLEAGDLKAWRKSWATAAATGLPRNAKTGQRYNGVNMLILWNEAQERGYSSNQWLTFKQAKELGAMVKKGSKGTLCVYFEMVAKKGEAAPAGDAGEGAQPGFFPMAKAFWVFNLDQIENLPENLQPTGAKEERPAFNPIEAAESILAGSDVTTHHGGNHAFYSRAGDFIQMPMPEAFARPEDYYATRLHEEVHATGSENRLNRTKGKRFGDEAYAMEELTAEFCAAALCGQCGIIEATIADHASYIDNWLRVLRADKTAIFTAAKLAGEAFDYMMGRASGVQAAA